MGDYDLKVSLNGFFCDWIIASVIRILPWYITMLEKIHVGNKMASPQLPD